MDTMEDFAQVRKELSAGKRREIRRSRLRDFISGPQLDTFRQLTPTATSFHSTPRAPHSTSQSSHIDGLPAMREFAAIKDLATMKDSKTRQRVTIHFDNGTPSLHVRFSALQIPPLAFDDKSRPHSEWYPARSQPVSYKRPSYQAAPPNQPSVLSRSESPVSAPQPEVDLRVFNPPTQKSRAQSSQSIPESITSLRAVRELASQFPGPPTRTLIRTLEPIQHSPPPEASKDFWDPVTPTLPEDVVTNISPMPKESSPVSTLYPPLIDPLFGKKLPTSVPAPADPPTRLLRNPSARFNYDVSVPSSATTATETMFSHYAPTTGRSVFTAETLDDFGAILYSSKSREIPTGKSSGGLKPADWMNYNAISPYNDLPSSMLGEGYKGRERPESGLPSYSASELHTKQQVGLNIPPPETSELDEEQREMENAMRQRRLGRAQVVGKSPRRATPAPIRTEYTPRSLYIEAVQGSLDSTYSPGVLRDSEVVGIEDGTWAKAVKEKGYF